MIVEIDQKEPILSLALREKEITETDIQIMLRVARDKESASGRYQRVPKRLSTVNKRQ